MSTFVLLEARIQPEKISEMKSSMEQILPETRSYDGCQGIDALFNVDEPRAWSWWSNGNPVVITTSIYSGVQKPA